MNNITGVYRRLTIADLIDMPMNILHNLYKSAFDTSVEEMKKRKKEEEQKKMEQNSKRRIRYGPTDIPSREFHPRSPIDDAARQLNQYDKTANHSVPSAADMEDLIEELE